MFFDNPYPRNSRSETESAHRVATSRSEPIPSRDPTIQHPEIHPGQNARPTPLLGIKPSAHLLQKVVEIVPRKQLV